MRAFASFYLFAGLVAAQFNSATPETGLRCCGQGTTDPGETCKKMKLDAFCCSNFKADRPKGGKGFLGGCDPIDNFKIGRNVIATASGAGGCKSNGQDGFVGCA
ncbi:hypothetical protein MCOR07_008140 [Pyricularia oryzae]|uniref:Uncharacterized protein n=3 Tax=Pyricularia oryzae TaxID=318829 RepID=G4N697_PYRO7|nr:uncharacterized protein MGG_17155 [Pyricularia oryzae 70-15]ELQ35682.1 hypothetical protein OOU_Y34scaffold00693g5 [Pyricularia oryzae Y34]KAI6275382.1 hypothetical protein MCOR26_006045 [Pyricularia oryzae]EHA50619.1 hypothetical protein MGG_17155 [Pyricularia oryzae 70-15]KAI6314229.1 hypothetical protein MCOR34_005019 [Pyricularia oryzae]KAI6320095.1 hypothetical protein MCOR29_005412 [Pyricularia oryzae]